MSARAQRLHERLARAHQEFRPKLPHHKDLIKRWKILKGDKVEIIDGKDKGKQGIVEQVVRARNSVVVGGCNLTKRYVKPTDTRSGAIILKESLIHVTNVALIDPDSNLPTRVYYKKDEDTGTTLRVSKATGAVIPKPPPPDMKREFFPHSDTKPEHVLEETYVAPGPVEQAGPLASLRLAARHSQVRQEYRHITDFAIIGASEELLQAALSHHEEGGEAPYPFKPQPDRIPGQRTRRRVLKNGAEIGYPNNPPGMRNKPLYKNPPPGGYPSADSATE